MPGPVTSTSRTRSCPAPIGQLWSLLHLIIITMIITILIAVQKLYNWLSSLFSTVFLSELVTCMQ